MRKMIITAALGWICLLVSCKEKQKGDAYCLYGKFNKIIKRDSAGNISRLGYSPANDTHGEILEFYPNGNLLSKGRVSNNKLNGPTYTYYPSGFTRVYRFFEDGKKVGYATNFYDSMDQVEATMWYNKEGQLIWRKTYSKNGDLISTEGDPSLR